MNERVARYLEKKEQEKRQNYYKERSALLIKEGLYEKVYSNDPTEEYPETEWDEESGSLKYYRKVPLNVTDEEYEEIRKHANYKPEKYTEEGLFANVGEKIMAFAKVNFGLGLAGALFYAIYLFSLAADYEDEFFGIMGVVVLIVGPILSLISSWFLYGFGELIQSTKNIDEKIKEK